MKSIKLIALGLFTSLATVSFGQKPNLLLEARNALFADSVEKFLTLLEQIPDVNKPIKGSIQEWTILHAACWKVNTVAVKAILAKGFKNINNDDNKLESTPLLALRCLTPEDMMKSMVDAYEMKVKQMENDPDLKKQLAPYLVKPSTNVADYSEPADIAKLLIDAGADVNARDLKSGSALQRAISAGNAKLVKVLTDAKAKN